MGLFDKFYWHKYPIIGYGDYKYDFRIRQLADKNAWNAYGMDLFDKFNGVTCNIFGISPIKNGWKPCNSDLFDILLG